MSGEAGQLGKKEVRGRARRVEGRKTAKRSRRKGGGSGWHAVTAAVVRTAVAGVGKGVKDETRGGQGERRRRERHYTEAVGVKGAGRRQESLVIALKLLPCKNIPRNAFPLVTTS